MGRTRSFDDEVVLAAAAAAFRERGYEATSVDDLVRVTGLHRGSLYSAFGSKRGIFVRALTRAGGLTPPPAGSAGATADADEPVEPVTPAIDDAVLDLVLVALLELSPRDDGVRRLVSRLLVRLNLPAEVLGRRLLVRAHLDPDAGSPTRPAPQETR